MNELCHYFYFDLIVTGKCEEIHLPELFKSLIQLGICRFKVIRRIGQLSPITSERRKEKMIGSGQIIPSKDEEIAITIRIQLKQPCHYIIIIDDLENDRAEQAQEVFQRYRQMLDVMLGQEKDRTSIHFLVNMLEAYYFADPKATNEVLGTNLENYEGDVEEIRHPKKELKNFNRNFKEIDDGGEILKRLDVEKILSNPETCASLRTIFAWCMQRMRQEFGDRYQLKTGKFNEITKTQI